MFLIFQVLVNSKEFQFIRLNYLLWKREEVFYPANAVCLVAAAECRRDLYLEYLHNSFFISTRLAFLFKFILFFFAFDLFGRGASLKFNLSDVLSLSFFIFARAIACKKCSKLVWKLPQAYESFQLTILQEEFLS